MATRQRLRAWRSGHRRKEYALLMMATVLIPSQSMPRCAQPCWAHHKADERYLPLPACANLAQAPAANIGRWVRRLQSAASAICFWSAMVNWKAQLAATILCGLKAA